MCLSGRLPALREEAEGDPAPPAPDSSAVLREQIRIMSINMQELVKQAKEAEDAEAKRKQEAEQAERKRNADTQLDPDDDNGDASMGGVPADAQNANPNAGGKATGGKAAAKQAKTAAAAAAKAAAAAARGPTGG